MPKSDPLTKRLCDFLFPLIDLYDGGIKYPDQDRPYRRNTNEAINLFYCQQSWPVAKRTCFPKRLTQKLVRRHLNGEHKLYYNPRRKSPAAFVMIDVDAHLGQTDARETAEFICDRFFPGAFCEPSSRGFHIYALLQVGRVRRARFNDRLAALEDDLRAVVKGQGFQSTVEVVGEFTTLKTPDEIEKRGQMGAIPRLINKLDDLDRLLTAPAFTMLAVDAVAQEADKLGPAHLGKDVSVVVINSIPDVYVARHQRVSSNTLESASAWDRMMKACFRFTEVYRRLPTIDDLLAFYVELFQTDQGKPARRKRAEQAIKYRAKTFDPVKVQRSGYETERPKLLAAVKRFCIDRGHKAGTKITDEDLAITLFVITHNSFLDRGNQRFQFTCPAACITGMFKTLGAAGITKRRAGSRNKIAAMKLVLERAQLIECIDATWSWGSGRRGKRYAVGPTHWRYSEWLPFASRLGFVPANAQRLAG